MKKISKILVANRGEIALRVMRTAREMGIATVAIYSDADKKSQHAIYADEAIHIGPSTASESYLIHEKVIEAAKKTGASASRKKAPAKRTTKKAANTNTISKSDKWSAVLQMGGHSPDIFDTS